MRFVHTADWQLGLTRHFLSEEAQARYAEARLEAVRRIGALARREGCAFILVAGDVFETNQVGRSVVLPALEAMASCEVPVLLLAGNHDALHAASVYKSRTFCDHRPGNVVVLGPGEVLELDGGRVVSAAWETKKPDENPAAGVLRRLAPDPRPTVLVAHGIVDAANPQSREPSVLSLAVLEAALSDGRLDYVALGDQHSMAAVGTTGAVYYSGSPLVTSYRETAPNRALVVELREGAVHVEEHVVGDWRFVEERFDLNTDDDVEGIDAWLFGLADRRRCVVSLRLVGTISLATKAHLDAVLERHREVLAGLELHERYVDLAVLPDDEDVAALGLTGFAAAALGELSELAEARADATAADAMGLLYRLATSSR